MLLDSAAPLGLAAGEPGRLSGAGLVVSAAIGLVLREQGRHATGLARFVEGDQVRLPPAGLADDAGEFLTPSVGDGDLVPLPGLAPGQEPEWRAKATPWR